jgi:hypothetical protein
MSRSLELLSRADASDRIARNRDATDSKLEETDRIAEDHGIVQDTFDDMDLGGTSEGIDQTSGRMAEAQDAAAERYEREDQEVERLQEENLEFGDDLGERAEADERDAEKVADAQRAIETREALDRIGQALASIEEDREILIGNVEEIEESHETTEERQRLQRESMDG